MPRLKYYMHKVLVGCLLLYLLALFVAVVVLMARNFQAVREEDEYNGDWLELNEQLLGEEARMGDNWESTMRKPLVQTLRRPHIKAAGHASSVWSPLKSGDSYSRGRRDVQFVLGVPTELRPDGQNHLLETLRTLVAHIIAEERAMTLIVVFVGEVRSAGVKVIVSEITANFGLHMESGLIDILTADKQLYHDLRRLRRTLNNATVTTEGVYWRSKRNLDCAALMRYAESRGHYYLQLTDDIVAKPDYLTYIHKFIVLHDAFQLSAQRPWLVCSFSALGTAGKLFSTKHLKTLIEFLEIFYKDQPNDWLLSHYVQMKVCPGMFLRRPECQRNLSQAWLESMETQFQRNGNATTLKQFSDKRYKRQHMLPQTQLHMRQPLALVQTHAMQIARTKEYDDDIIKQWQPNNELYFWGYLPQLNGMLTHIFEHPNTRRQYRIYKGATHMSAEFEHAILDLLPPAEAAELRANQTPAGKREGFIVACRFNKHSDEVTRAAFYALDNGAEAGIWLRVMRDDCSRQMVTTICLLISFYTCL